MAVLKGRTGVWGFLFLNDGVCFGYSTKIEKEKREHAKQHGMIRTEITGAEIAEEMEKERRLFQLQMCEVRTAWSQPRASDAVPPRLCCRSAVSMPQRGLWFDDQRRGLFLKDSNLHFSPSLLGSAVSLLSHILSPGPKGLFKPKRDSLVRTLILLVSECGKKKLRSEG